MTELLLLISLIAPVTTPVEDCVKTRTCAAAAKADFEICLFPKKCAPKAVEAIAQFQPCVWPNTCAKPAPVLAQFQPCVWPNRCSGRRSETVVL